MSPAAALTDARKFLAALAGALAQVVELGLLHGTVLHYAQVASAIVTAAIVYVVPGPNSPSAAGVVMGEAQGGAAAAGDPSPGAPVT